MSEDLFTQALNHHQRGEYPLAEHLYRRVLSLQPQHAGALHYLGVLAMQAGHLDDAVGLMQQALSLESGIPDYFSNLGNALARLGRWQEAAGQFERALALNPAFAEAHSNLANVYKQLGNFEAALNHLQRAIAGDPRRAAYQVNLGNLHRLQQRFAEAEACYRRALELDAGCLEALHNLAEAARQQNQPELAIAHYRELIRLRPHPAYLHTLGLLLQQTTQLAEATEVFEQALALAPDQPQLQASLGLVLHERGQLEAAVGHYRQALAQQPARADLHCHLGHALEALGRPDEAFEALERALALKPDWAELWLKKLALQQERQPDTVAAEYRQLLATYPELPEAHYAFAQLLTRLEQIAEAQGELDLALELEPFYPQALLARARLHLTQQRPDAALFDLEEAIKMDPNQAEPHQLLGELYEARGELPQAHQHKHLAYLLARDEREYVR